MPKLTPVEGNPFEQGAKLTPVEGNPFAEPPAEGQGLLRSAADTGLEFASAVNRGATELVDFAAGAVPNAAAYMAGSDWRMPRLTDALDPATQGNFMEDGLAKDVVRTSGEVIPAAVAGGGVLRTASNKLPALASGADDATTGVLREIGKTSAGADAGLGALSGAGMPLGGEAGEMVGGDTGRQIGEMVGALALPVAGGAMASRLAAKPLAKPMAEIADEGGLTREGARLTAAGKIKPEQAQAAVETAEQQARRQAFEKVGVQPTKAQLTRNADDFSQQQELGKSSGKIRSALEEQDAVLTQRVDELAESTGGASREAYETGYAIEDAISSRVLYEDELINGLYRQADEIAGGAANVRLERFAEAMRKASPADDSVNKIISSLRGELAQQGVMAKDGFKSTAKLTAEQTERMVRQRINSYYDNVKGDGKAKGILGDLKRALDEDVYAAAGDDFYRQAREAVTKSRGALEQVKKHKFYKNDKSAVKQILEGRIAPEDIFNKLVVGKGGKVDDIKLLKTYLDSGEGELAAAGKAAWNDLRGQTLVHLRDRATKALATNQQGERTFNGAEFSKAIDSIGAPKLKEILNADELEALESIAKVGTLRMPVPGTALGDGPSAKAVNRIFRLLTLNYGPAADVLANGVSAVGNARAARGVLDGRVIDMPVRQVRDQGRSVAPLVGVLETAN